MGTAHNHRIPTERKHRFEPGEFTGRRADRMRGSAMRGEAMDGISSSKASQVVDISWARWRPSSVRLGTPTS